MRIHKTAGCEYGNDLVFLLFLFLFRHVVAVGCRVPPLHHFSRPDKVPKYLSCPRIVIAIKRRPFYGTLKKKRAQLFSFGEFPSDIVFLFVDFVFLSAVSTALRTDVYLYWIC